MVCLLLNACVTGYFAADVYGVYRQRPEARCSAINEIIVTDRCSQLTMLCAFRCIERLLSVD